MHYGPASFYLGETSRSGCRARATVTAMEARKNGGFAIMQKAFDEKLGSPCSDISISASASTSICSRSRSAPRMAASTSTASDSLAADLQVLLRGSRRGLGLGAGAGSLWRSRTVRLRRRRLADHRTPGFELGQVPGSRHHLWLRSTDLGITINTAKLNSLPQAAKDILTKAAIEYEQVFFDNFQKEIKATDETARSRGMTVLKLTGAAEKAYLDKAYESPGSA